MAASEMGAAAAAADKLVGDEFVKLISSVSVTPWKLVEDKAQAFECTTIISAPCLCFDVVLQKMCVVLRFTLLSCTEEITITGHVVLADGQVVEYQCLKRLQYLKPLVSGLKVEKYEDLAAEINVERQKPEADIGTFVASRPFVLKDVCASLKDELMSLAIVTSGDGGEADKAPEDKVPEVVTVAAGTGDDATSVPADEQQEDKPAPEPTVTTGQVRTQLVTTFKEPTRFSRQSKQSVFDIDRGIRRGQATVPPAIEVQTGDKQVLVFGGIDVLLWEKTYRVICLFYYYRQRVSKKPRLPPYVMLLNLSAIRDDVGEPKDVWAAASLAANEASKNQYPEMERSMFDQTFGWLRWVVTLELSIFVKHAELGNLHLHHAVADSTTIAKHILMSAEEKELKQILLTKLPSLKDPTAKPLRKPIPRQLKPPSQFGRRRSTRARAPPKPIIQVSLTPRAKRAQPKRRPRRAASKTARRTAPKCKAPVTDDTSSDSDGLGDVRSMM